MSSVKTVGLLTAGSAILLGGAKLGLGLRNKKIQLQQAKILANKNNGKIPTGGIKPDGTLWDGFTTIDEINKKANKLIAIDSAATAVTGAVVTGIISASTLFLKSKLK